MSKLKPETEALGVAYCEDAKNVVLQQAYHIRELEKALNKLARLGNGPHLGNSDGNVIAQKALGLKRD